jgi:hypothetical protein
MKRINKNNIEEMNQYVNEVLSEVQHIILDDITLSLDIKEIRIISDSFCNKDFVSLLFYIDDDHTHYVEKTYNPNEFECYVATCIADEEEIMNAEYSELHFIFNDIEGE